jgi:hypothetical protein
VAQRERLHRRLIWMSTLSLVQEVSKLALLNSSVGLQGRRASRHLR